MRDVRMVIIHRPGPKWQHGLAIPEQPGVEAHVEHYRRVFESGKLELGGPFLDEGGGGMMVPVADLGEDEIRAIAASDPSVAAGLVTYEIRPWLIGMRRA